MRISAQRGKIVRDRIGRENVCLTERALEPTVVTQTALNGVDVTAYERNVKHGCEMTREAGSRAKE